MAEFRIVKIKHCRASYKVQKKVLFFFWHDWVTCETLEYCRSWIVDEKKREQIKKANPKDIIVE